MPAIKSQSQAIAPDGNSVVLTIVSTFNGTIVTTGVRSGSSVTMEMRRDGVLVSGAGITNPRTITTATAAEIESWINATFIAGGFGLQLASHIFTLVPLNMTLMTYNLGDSPPANWWLS